MIFSGCGERYNPKTPIRLTKLSIKKSQYLKKNKTPKFNTRQA